MTTTDEALTEQIARAIRLADTGDSLPAGFAARMWDEGVTNRGKEMHLAAAVLPIIRAQMAEAWDSCAHEADRRWVIGGHSAALLHDANPYRQKVTS